MGFYWVFILFVRILVGCSYGGGGVSGRLVPYFLFALFLFFIMASPLLFSVVASLVAGYPAVSFSGSRHGSADAVTFISALAAVSPSLPVRVGCAAGVDALVRSCLLYTSPSPRDATLSRMPSSA